MAAQSIARLVVLEGTSAIFDNSNTRTCHAVGDEEDKENAENEDGVLRGRGRGGESHLVRLTSDWEMKSWKRENWTTASDWWNLVLGRFGESIPDDSILLAIFAGEREDSSKKSRNRFRLATNPKPKWSKKASLSN
jgi:hypothetical protein